MLAVAAATGDGGCAGPETRTTSGPLRPRSGSFRSQQLVGPAIGTLRIVAGFVAAKTRRPVPRAICIATARSPMSQEADSQGAVHAGCLRILQVKTARCGPHQRRAAAIVLVHGAAACLDFECVVQQPGQLVANRGEWISIVTCPGVLLVEQSLSAVADRASQMPLRLEPSLVECQYARRRWPHHDIRRPAPSALAAAARSSESAGKSFEQQRRPTRSQRLASQAPRPRVGPPSGPSVRATRGAGQEPAGRRRAAAS